MEAARIQKRFNSAVTLRREIEKETFYAYKYTLPAKQSMSNVGKEQDRTQIYDGTATSSVNNLATNIESNLLPQNVMWGELALREATTSTLEKRNRLMKANAVIHEHFKDSNFYLATYESILDCVITGTGCIAIREDDEGISYEAIPIGELYILSNARGVINTVFRTHELTAEQIAEHYSNIPSYVQEAVKETPQKKYSVIESAITNNRITEYGVWLTTSTEGNYMGITKGGEWHKLVYQKQKHNPFIVYRWTRMPGTVWGDSQVKQALPHIVTANEIMKDVLIATEYAANGLWQDTNQGGYNPKTLRNQVGPGKVISPESKLEAMQFPGDIRVGAQTLQDHRMQIRELLFDNDLPQLAQGDNSYMTAYETSVRHEKFLRVVGKPALRFQKELLEPVFEQVVLRMVDSGDLEMLKGIEHDIESKVESAADKSMKISEAMNDLSVLTQAIQAFTPQVIAKNVDLDKASRKFLLNTGFSVDLFKSEEEIQQQTEREEQGAQAEQALNAAQQGSDILNSLSQIDASNFALNQ
ncbi:portal protein [Magnetovibrio sp. PR-2]|uniref:portal protein n=1 Tax=Magnetovibrio sp. PR-2 TaxID=3120356 RepID=UPI002FCE18B9